MKKNKGNEFERTEISWEEFEKEISAERQEKKDRDKYEWDRPMVDESWSIDEPVTGEIPSIKKEEAKQPDQKEAPAKEHQPGGITELLPSEEAIYQATLDEDIDLSAAISRKLDSVADVGKVDEQAIRATVDQKIVIKSEELKGKRKEADGEPKRKVRRRIPKTAESHKESHKEEDAKRTRLSAEEKAEKKYGQRQRLPEDPGMSAFRERSMNWKDAAEDQIPNMEDAEGIGFGKALSGFFAHFKRYTALEWVSVALALIIVASAAMTTAVYANYKGELNKEKALASLKQFAETKTERVAETVVEEEKTASVGAQDEIVEVKSLSLVLTSVEKDLKIKLVDQDDTLVKDVPWGVTVTDEDGRVSDNDDDDEDGVIYLTDIGAGDYSVALKPSDALAGYILPNGAQTVSVKAKVEYKVIANIKDEIKTEKEVNAAVEDNGNKPADVETEAVTDTVEWVESTKTANGEAYVESAVDLSKSMTASAFNLKKALTDAIASLSAKANNTYRTVVGMPLLVAENPTTDDTNNTGTPPETNTENTEPPADTTPKVTLVGVPTSLTVGETATFSLETENCNASDVTCTVDDGGFVSISDKTIKAEKAGTATLAAMVNGNTVASAQIKINNKDPETKPVTGITVSFSSATVAVGASTTATATISPSDASNKAVTWNSGDEAIATVDANGKVTGKKAGEVEIFATAADGSGVNNSAKIKVTDAAATNLITKLTLNTAEFSISVGGNYQLNYAVEPTTIKKESVKIKWTSSNASVATVSETGGTVTGKALGTAIITATAQDGSGKTATCKVTVTDKEPDLGAQLYDKDKNPLYRKKDDGTYVLAKYSDYKADTSIKLYKKVQDFLYTGWQTIDGKTYYYKRDNTYVTGDQVIGGVTYHFATDGSLTKGSGTLGIDVSKYQPNINWSSVKNSGVSFVIIRCGYRGASTGVLIEDPYFKSHIKGAKAAGLKVGVYFFTTALTEAEAIEEASMCAYLCGGYGINYPVFMDCESSSRPGYNSLSASDRTKIIQAFCNTLKSAGYTPGVYANKTWLTEKMSASALSGYKIWLAQYNASGPTYNGRYDLWQYTSKGSVSGISGNVDMNQSYLGY